MTISTIRHDAFIASPTGTDGETFVLHGSNIRATLFGLSNNTTFIHGSNNGLLLSTDSNESIVDRGRGTQISDAFAQGNTNIYGFQNDSTGSFTMMFMTTANLQASMRPDGHGGTMVGTGGFTVDFVGAAHLDPAQLHGIVPV